LGIGATALAQRPLVDGDRLPKAPTTTSPSTYVYSYVPFEPAKAYS